MSPSWQLRTPRRRAGRARSQAVGRPAVVLHVTESFGGGTRNAIRSYAASTPDLHHFVLYRVRASESEALPSHGFRGLQEWERGLRGVRQFRATIRRLEPIAVHLHSSRAGFVGRLAAPSGTRVVYTPHCFGFERRDLPMWVRLAIRIIEYVLCSRTTVMAGCSSGETDTALRWRSCRTGLTIPNLPADVHFGSTRPSGLKPDPPGLHRLARVVMVGRCAPQKGPGAFARLSGDSRLASKNLRFTWVGGGDAQLEGLLREAEVEVTGWVTTEASRALVGSADLYVHTAEWEGFPLSVLEAVWLGIPVICSSIPAFATVPDRVKFADHEGAVALLENFFSANLQQNKLDNLSTWHAALSGHTVEAQRRALAAAYGLAHDA